MNKQEFLERLRIGLADLPQEEIEAQIDFYTEIIDDRMEDGVSEGTAIAELGDVDEIISLIITNNSGKEEKKAKSKRRLKAWEIILLAVGSPLWISLGISAVAVIFSVYFSLWSIVVSMWAIFVSLIGCSLGGVAYGVFGIFYSGNTLAGIAILAAGLVCAGLSILLFFVCKWATKGMVLTAQKTVVGIKNALTKKGETK